MRKYEQQMIYLRKRCYDAFRTICQTIIEPTLDMWTREKRGNNILANDPKGELLQKFYVPATVRGYSVCQFNLINELKTDIYNPLALAAEAARENDFTQCSTYIENIAGVFFPLDGGEDPVWPNAANNAFKRASYGLIDYYLEQERQLKNDAAKTGMSAMELDTAIDQLWGKVTLYNCYQLFVQLTARKRPTPIKRVQDLEKRLAQQRQAEAEAQEANLQAGEIPRYLTDEELALMEDQERWNKFKQDAQFDAEHIWQGSQELDELSLYFNATELLPNNGIRTLVTNANNALKSMGAAEKMLASCDVFDAEKASLQLAA